MRPGFALGNDFFRTSQDLLNGEFLLLKTAEQTMNLRQQLGRERIDFLHDCLFIVNSVQKNKKISRKAAKPQGERKGNTVCILCDSVPSKKCPVVKSSMQVVAVGKFPARSCLPQHPKRFLEPLQQMTF